MTKFTKDTWFEGPTQVAIKIVYPTEEVETFCGIGYKDEVICGCCGDVFCVDELGEDGAVYKVLKWISISDEIAGGEDPFEDDEAEDSNS